MLSVAPAGCQMLLLLWSISCSNRTCGFFFFHVHLLLKETESRPPSSVEFISYPIAIAKAMVCVVFVLFVFVDPQMKTYRTTTTLPLRYRYPHPTLLTSLLLAVMNRKMIFTSSCASSCLQSRFATPLLNFKRSRPRSKMQRLDHVYATAVPRQIIRSLTHLRVRD